MAICKLLSSSASVEVDKLILAKIVFLSNNSTDKQILALIRSTVLDNSLLNESHDSHESYVHPNSELNPSHNPNLDFNELNNSDRLDESDESNKLDISNKLNNKLDD